jgi:dihydrofolate reductase
VGQVIAAEYVTLDGVMQDPGGVGEIERGGWSNPFWNDELQDLQRDLLFASDALLLGRITYEGFAAAWPSLEHSEHEEQDFVKKMNTMPKYVASRNLEETKWNATLLKGDVSDEVAKLKQQPGQNLLIYGSGALVNTLMQYELIDQYRLMVYPVILGQGKRLFREGSDKSELRLTATNTVSMGVVILDYEPPSTAGQP